MTHFTRYAATSPNSELSGRGVISLTSNLMRDEMEAIMQRHNLSNVQPDGWYSLQDYFDAVKEVEEHVGPNGLTSIGMAVANSAGFPPEIDSVEAVLQSFEAVYQFDHRNIAPDEGWHCEMTADRDALVYARNPYPMHLNYGLIWGAVRRFLPEHYGFIVEVKETLEDNNGAYDLYHVTWKRD